MPNRRPLSLVVCAVVFICALVFLQGCYLCPYEEYVYGIDFNYSFKMGDDVPAKRWFPLQTIRFEQPTDFPAGRLFADAMINQSNNRAFKGKLRANLYNQSNQHLATWKWNFKVKKNGDIKQPLNRNFQYRFQTGYRLELEGWFSKKQRENDLWVTHIAFEPFL